MKPITAKRAMQLLRERGWRLSHTTGSHFIFEHPENPLVIPVPNHSRDLREGTQHSIMKVAGIRRDEL